MTSNSLYSRLVLVTEKEYSIIKREGSTDTAAATISNPLPPHIGPDQQYKLQTAKYLEDKAIEENNQVDNHQHNYSHAGPQLTDHISAISSNFSKGKIGNALALLTFLNNQEQSVFSWDEYGQVVANNKTIIGSNLIDLIRHATSDSRKRNKPTPVGWDEFKALLALLNVSKAILSNATLEEMGIVRVKRRTEPAPISPQASSSVYASPVVDWEEV